MARLLLGVTVKVIEVNGVRYRFRRGKLVKIPALWVRKTVSKRYRKGRTKEGREGQWTKGNGFPRRDQADVSGEDARSGDLPGGWRRRRRMMPEPRVPDEISLRQELQDSAEEEEP